jgi:hypothetical protein
MHEHKLERLLNWNWSIGFAVSINSLKALNPIHNTSSVSIILRDFMPCGHAYTNYISQLPFNSVKIQQTCVICTYYQ